MAICARCCKPIKGESKRVMTDSPTNAGEVEVHADWCKPAPRQTAPSGFGR